ncbi:MAG: NAD(P)-dependent oxidoreductase [Gemmatimonadaceae bacterium]|nr:NAD(P)-dependent oxidoreductase [Gemmatimonadaceae bacterium]
MSSGYAGVRVLVLGASGFIGRWVARSLASCGADVTCGVRDVAAMRALSNAYGLETRVVPVDLLDAMAVADLIDAWRPTITFNLAGYGIDRSERNEARSWRINAELVEQLGELVHRTPSGLWPGQRLVHAGSALEYGPIGGSLPEDARPAPTTLYGVSKLAGTRSLVDQWPLSSVTARLFTVYGPGEHDGRLLPTLLEARRHTQLVGLSEGLQLRDFTYVEDVAEGLLRLGRQPSIPGGVVNLATGRQCRVRDFAETTAVVLGIPSSRLSFGALPGRTDEMPHDAVSVTRLRQILGWVPSISVADGVQRTALFFGVDVP